jgi:hypothetical protein
MWSHDREDVRAKAKKMISSKGMMLSVNFSRTGFVSIQCLPEGQKYDSQFFPETILPSLTASLPVWSETEGHSGTVANQQRQTT